MDVVVQRRRVFYLPQHRQLRLLCGAVCLFTSGIVLADLPHLFSAGHFCDAALYAAPALLVVGVVGPVVVAKDARLPQLPGRTLAHYVSGCIVAGVDVQRPAFFSPPGSVLRMQQLAADVVPPALYPVVLALGPLAGVVALRHDAAGLQLSGCAFCEDFPGQVVLYGVEIRFAHVLSFSCAIAAVAFSSSFFSLSTRRLPFPARRPSSCITARFKKARFCSS